MIFVLIYIFLIDVRSLIHLFNIYKYLWVIW